MSKTVHIVAIIDRSGSMGNIMNEVISTYNSFIDSQNKIPGKAKVTLVAFDHEYNILLNKVNLKDTVDISLSDVKPRGMTALYDAIGKTISLFDKKKKVVMLIQTDGYENSSKEFDIAAIKKMITQKQEDGWDINFFGTGVDAWESSGRSMGLSVDKCKSFSKDPSGVKALGSEMCAYTTSYRANN